MLAPPGNAPGRQTEQSIILSVRNELSSVNHSLRPSVEAFLKTSKSGTIPQSNFDFEHKRLGELLLQSLLRLDALSPESQWTEARMERKQAVKEIQNMLTELDGVSNGDQAS